MSNLNAEEKTNLLIYSKEMGKSSFNSSNSNSTSDSFEETINGFSKNSKVLNSSSTNKVKPIKKCKHNYKLLKKFYKNKNKKANLPHKQSLVSNNSDKDSKEALDSGADLKSNFQNKNNENYSGKKPFRSICFCTKCRGLIIKLANISAINKDKLFTVAYLPSEAIKSYSNPIEMFYNMQTSDANKGLIFINNYSKKRKDMISFIAKLRNKYKISLDSFYLAIALLDNICSKMVKFNVDIELLTIGCFFLAGKFLENDAYLGEFEHLTLNFKKIYYSVEEMHKSEVYCLNQLNFNLSMTTVKQYYDIFCLTGFIFDDELNSVKDIKEFYQSGISVLKELITDFKSTSFCSLSLAFSVVRYLREANMLETKNPRMHILESIYGIKHNFYFHAWELLKKIKNFHSVCDNNSNKIETNCIKFKLNNDLFTKNTISNGHAIYENKQDYFKSAAADKTKCFYLENKENEFNKDLDNPNAIQFKTLSNRIYSNNNKTFLNSNIAIINSSNKNSNLNTNNLISNNIMKSSYNRVNDNSDLPSIRSVSFTKDQMSSKFSTKQFRKESDLQSRNYFNNNYNGNNNEFSIGSKEKLRDSVANVSSEITVEAIVNKLYSSNTFKNTGTKQKFASTTEIKVINLIATGNHNINNEVDSNNDGINSVNNISAKIKDIVIEKRIYNNQDENSFNLVRNSSDCKANINSNLKLENKNSSENINLEEGSNSNIISKINQQLKSSTTKKLVSINPNSTFNVSSSVAPIKINNSGKIPDERDFSLKKPSNLLANSLSSIKVFLNPNAPVPESNSNNNQNEIAAAPIRRSGKVDAVKIENDAKIEFKKRISKRLSYENLPKVDFGALGSLNGIINNLNDNQAENILDNAHNGFDNNNNNNNINFNNGNNLKRLNDDCSEISKQVLRSKFNSEI